MNVRDLIKALSEYDEDLPCDVVLEEIGIEVAVVRWTPNYLGDLPTGDEAA